MTIDFRFYQFFVVSLFSSSLLMMHTVLSISLLWSGMVKMVGCGWYIIIEISIFYLFIFFTRTINNPKDSWIWHSFRIKIIKNLPAGPSQPLASRFRYQVNINQFFTSVVTGYTSCPLCYHCIINTEWFVLCTALTLPINWAHFPPPPMSHYWMLSSTELVCLHSLWGSLT